jgi:inhibitor of KinA
MSDLTDTFRIYPVSEKAVTVELGDRIDAAVLSRVQALERSLMNAPFMGMETTVPAYSTLTVFFDPALVKRCSQLKGETNFERVSGYLRQLTRKEQVPPLVKANPISIPVCYGGHYGPDLWEVAHHHHISEEEVIALHTGALYTVYMIGFLPGFAYLGGLPEELETPRRDTPRKAVSSGSLGIGGKQTGIYPLESPGGWQIIGRTPLKLFDVKRSPAALLKAGDLLRFVPISYSEFESYRNGNDY